MTLVDDFKVHPGRRFHLKKVDPSYTARFTKEHSSQVLKRNIERLIEQQNRLSAENRRAVLIIFQGMDTCGKDGAIRHVMSGINPQGCTVVSFKAPSPDELDHDFLWRIHKAVPAKGDIGIFNRSHYEDVIAVRVRKLVPREVWEARYDQINQFEEFLVANGVTILKFFLHISKDEQKERLEARLRDPAKHWKFNLGDLDDRAHWNDYMDAYQDAVTRCSTKAAPWYVIPANKKWFRNLVVSEIIDETLESMDLRLPKGRLGLSKIKVT